jgi:hypothetical protein
MPSSHWPLSRDANMGSYSFNSTTTLNSLAMLGWSLREISEDALVPYIFNQASASNQQPVADFAACTIFSDVDGQNYCGA